MVCRGRMVCQLMAKKATTKKAKKSTALVTQKKKPRTTTEETGLSEQDARFVEGVAQGMAYGDAYTYSRPCNKASRSTQNVNGWKEAQKPRIQEAIQQQRAIEQERHARGREIILNQYLDAITTPVGNIDETSPLAQEVERVVIGTKKDEKTGKESEILKIKVKMLDKHKAAENYLKATGGMEPVRVEVTTKEDQRVIEMLEARARGEATEYYLREFMRLSSAVENMPPEQVQKILEAEAHVIE